MIGEIIGGALGALGGLFGSAGRNKAIRKQMRMLADRQRDNQDWYDQRYNEDATQRADAQRILSLTEERLKQRNRAAAARSAVMGGTNESVAAEKEAGNQALADATSQIAVAAEQRKGAIEQQYRQKKDALAEAQAELEAKKHNGYDIANSMIGGAGAGIGGVLG